MIGSYLNVSCRDKADENTMSSNEEDNTVEQEEPKEEKDSKTKTKKEKKKKKKRKKELGPLETQPQRTIFVGNVHNDVQINVSFHCYCFQGRSVSSC